MANLIEDATEWDEHNDFVKKRRKPKGIHFMRLTQLINSCGITFSVWQKKDGYGKRTGNMDWTSLMGDERKKLLRNLPTKLYEYLGTIHRDTAHADINRWKVHF